ncbi:hypothetical protein D3C74_217040 [compost metagenome]
MSSPNGQDSPAAKPGMNCRATEGPSNVAAMIKGSRANVVSHKGIGRPVALLSVASLIIGPALLAGQASPAAAAQDPGEWYAVTETVKATESEHTGTSNMWGGQKADIPAQFNAGLGEDRLVTQVVTPQRTFNYNTKPMDVRAVRVDNATDVGQKQTLWVTDWQGQTEVEPYQYDINSSWMNSAEEALTGRSIGSGMDNVFVNDNEVEHPVTHSNIERLDLLVDPVSVVTPENTGMMLFEAKGDDPVSVAAILAVDESGNPTKYGELKSYSPDNWKMLSDGAIGAGPLEIHRLILEQNEGQPWHVTNFSVPKEQVGALFVSADELGVTAGQTFYGISLVGGDVTSDHDLLNPESFPRDSQQIYGGLDLVAGFLMDSPSLQVEKTSNAPEPTVAGSKVEYSVKFTNDGDVSKSLDFVDGLENVLDDADFVADSITVSNGAAVAERNADGKLVVTGDILPGETITVKYSVIVKSDADRIVAGGDNNLVNFILPAGSIPPEECVLASTLCTVNPVESPDLKVSKTANPVSTTEVVAGQEVVYKLVFENAGTAPVDVNYIDYLETVLDDADVVSQPESDHAEISANSITNGNFVVSGTLGAGESATIQYSVKVKSDGSRGDSNLDNFLVDYINPSGPAPLPPESCVVENGLCTTHPVVESEDPDANVNASASAAANAQPDASAAAQAAASPDAETAASAASDATANIAAQVAANEDASKDASVDATTDPDASAQVSAQAAALADNTTDANAAADVAASAQADPEAGKDAASAAKAAALQDASTDASVEMEGNVDAAADPEADVEKDANVNASASAAANAQPDASAAAQAAASPDAETAASAASDATANIAAQVAANEDASKDASVDATTDPDASAQVSAQAAALADNTTDANAAADVAASAQADPEAGKDAASAAKAAALQDASTDASVEMEGNVDAAADPEADVEKDANVNASASANPESAKDAKGDNPEAQGPKDELASTGAKVGGVVMAALALAGAGIATVFGSRRRKPENATD